GSGVPSNTGSFTRQNVHVGNYRINLAAILNLAPTTTTLPAALQNAYVKSIRYGDLDVLNDVLRIEGPPTDSLTIVIGTNPGSASGVVLDNQQEPLSDVAVVLVPANQRNRADLYKSATTDATGRFLIERIPPGDYHAFAFEEIESGAWHDAQFMRAFEERGMPIRVTEGAKLEFRLPILAPSQ
ncbi:MAG: carboxypeptidase regulatory-like domain-containing protein, partial [Acidobacteria bacterium]|nr:carboxypeptidase regulatory-like domain-containing protein [Acidobacteriota bacterium]